MIKMKKRFTLIDYAIIILVICAIVFAFIHITSDNQATDEKTSYDSSTLNKIVEKYLNYYRQGLIVSTSIEGYNSTDGQPVSISGNILWMDDDRGSNVKAIVNSNGHEYLAGLYNQVPEADIYIESMTLEVNGDKYNNLTEITVNPKNITSLNDLKLNNNTNWEISTSITLDSLDSTKMQEITNSLYSNHDRISVKGLNSGLNNQLSLTRATGDEITDANNILGEFNGVSDRISIRIYNCTGSDIDAVKNNFDVINIQKF